MAPSQKLSSTSLILSALISLVSAQTVTDPTTGVVTIPKPNGSDGWCYPCSADDAPPLCNADCNVAINRLCAEDLNLAMTTTEKSCQLEYLPPPYQFTTNGAHTLQPTETDCIAEFSGILNMCGRDAGTPALASNGVNLTYCTSTGGGGNYGWMDDGTPIAGKPRMRIVSPNSHQCGQAQATWQQADSCIVWNDDWVSDNDQVVLVTDQPPSPALTAVPAFPSQNPECEDPNQVCNLRGLPYYATHSYPPWQDGTKSQLRHRVIFEGWDVQAGALTFFNALHDRCQAWPNNWQVYLNSTATSNQTIADFDLPSYSKKPIDPLILDVGTETDLCWCIPYAIYDASVGLSTSVADFCGSVTFPSMAALAPVKKRGLEVGGGLMMEVTGTVEEVRLKRREREEKKSMEKRKRELEERFVGIVS